MGYSRDLKFSILINNETSSGNGNFVGEIFVSYKVNAEVAVGGRKLNRRVRMVPMESYKKPMLQINAFVLRKSKPPGNPPG